MWRIYLRGDSIRVFLGLLGTVALFSAVTLILKLLQPGLAIQLIALLYLLPVLLATVLWGLWAGLLGGFIAFLCFNYFFIPPYYTLVVHQSKDLITLIVFLIVVVVMSQLVGQAKNGIRLARKREWEATKMYELIAELAGLTREEEIIATLTRKIKDTFGFSQVDVLLEGGEAVRPGAETTTRDLDSSLVIPMETASRVTGEILVSQLEQPLSFEEHRLLVAFGYQGALAVERAHLFRRENVARVLEESDKVKTALLNSISHELRSPLAAIKASVSSLRSGAIDWNDNARADLLMTVEEETDHLNLLVGNLLDMSRIEAGALLLKKQWNSLAEIVSGVVRHASSQALKHTIQLDLPPDLPLLPTDYVMMEQVFSNLISNSLKYAPESSPIFIGAARENDRLHIRVVNQSPSVPEEHLEHIFDKFFRITQADKVLGTGLGLSICKGIIEAHGGRIWAENSKEGFCFHITLPLTMNGESPRVPEDPTNE